MADAEQLMPAYLRFVKGVIDSNDLPLNVSREILQESRDVKAIREGCAKRVLSMLEDMAENRKDDYVVFWREFGQVLKEGIGEDIGNQARIAALLRFNSTVEAPAPPAPAMRRPRQGADGGDQGSRAEVSDEATAAELQRRRGRQAGLARRLQGADEAGAGSDLLRHRRDARRRRATARTWRCSARRASRSCC